MRNALKHPYLTHTQPTVPSLKDGVIASKKLAPGAKSLKTAAGPTPRHNARVALDCKAKELWDSVIKARECCTNFKNAEVLLQAWVERSQPKETVGPLSLDVLRWILADVILNNKSTWQHAEAFLIFKRILKWLVEHDLSNSTTKVVARLGGKAAFVIGKYYTRMPLGMTIKREQFMNILPSQA